MGEREAAMGNGEGEVALAGALPLLILRCSPKFAHRAISQVFARIEEHLQRQEHRTLAVLLLFLLPTFVPLQYPNTFFPSLGAAVQSESQRRAEQTLKEVLRVRSLLFSPFSFLSNGLTIHHSPAGLQAFSIPLFAESYRPHRPRRRARRLPQRSSRRPRRRPLRSSASAAIP